MKIRRTSSLKAQSHESRQSLVQSLPDGESFSFSCIPMDNDNYDNYHNYHDNYVLVLVEGKLLCRLVNCLYWIDGGLE